MLQNAYCLHKPHVHYYKYFIVERRGDISLCAWREDRIGRYNHVYRRRRRIRHKRENLRKRYTCVYNLHERNILQGTYVANNGILNEKDNNCSIGIKCMLLKISIAYNNKCVTLILRGDQSKKFWSLCNSFFNFSPIHPCPKWLLHKQ